jgi:hypothetical protein
VVGRVPLMACQILLQRWLMLALDASPCYTSRKHTDVVCCHMKRPQNIPAVPAYVPKWFARKGQACC